MKIWVLQTGEPLHIDAGSPRPMRGMNISNYFVMKGHEVILWSSCFYHQEKKHRSLQFKSININNNLTINLIPSPGYKKNIGLGRLWDHFILAYNLKKILSSNEFDHPDFAFIGYPPIEIGFVMINWLQNKKTKIVLDIKDQWPEYFIANLPKKFRRIGRLILSPYFIISKQMMRKVDGICSMTNTYKNWAKNFSKTKDKKWDYVLPLTSKKLKPNNKEIELARNSLIKKGLQKNKKIISFVGSLSKAFNFEPIQKAIRKLSKERDDFLFIICGDGDDSSHIKYLFKDQKNVKFFGWINLIEIIVLFDISLASMAPYKNYKNFNLNVPNKIVDSLANDLLFITSLKGEVEQLVDLYNVGFICDENPQSWYNAFLKVLDTPYIKNEFATRCRLLYEKKFDCNNNYLNYISEIEKKMKK